MQLNFFAEKHGKSPCDAHFGALAGYYERYTTVIGDVYSLRDLIKAYTWGHKEASKKREKLGLPLAPLWLIEYCEITEYAPYDLLEIPRITSTYALTSSVKVFGPNHLAIHVNDRVFADCDFGTGRVVEEDTVKPGKRNCELAPRPKCRVFEAGEGLLI